MTQEPMVFEVGDKVTIVSEPCTCLFSWVRDMDAYCGLEAEIVSKMYTPGGYCYSIDVDGGKFVWCGKCFIPYEGTDSFNISDDEFNRILMC